MDNILICRICGREFKSFRGLSSHIRQTHKISHKKYYDLYLKKENEGICLECGNNTSFKSINKGYCIYCGNKCSSNSTEKKNKIKNNCLGKYGVEHPSQLEKIKGKTKQTNLERYGVEYPTQLESTKNKIKKTNLEKYGTGCSLHSENIKNKVKQTNLKKYGVEYSLQSKDVRDKIKQTNLKKYGVEYLHQNKKIHEKYIQTNLERYGVEYPIQSEKIKNKIKKTNIKKYGFEYPNKNKKIKDKRSKTNMEKYGFEYYSQTEEGRKKLQLKMLNGQSAYLNSFIKNPSKPQVELFNLIKEIYPTAILNYPIMNYSIDIVIPELKIAFEYDGSYWHKDKEEYDQKRQKEIEDLGWKFIRYIDNVPSEDDIIEDITILLKD